MDSREYNQDIITDIDQSDNTPEDQATPETQSHYDKMLL